MGGTRFLFESPLPRPQMCQYHNAQQSPAQHDSTFQSFIHLEFSVSTREMMISLFKTIFFKWEDPLLFIPAKDLELLLCVALESVKFDQKALFEIFKSFCKDQHGSPSYSSVMESKGNAFSQLLEQQQNDQLAKCRCKEHVEVYRLQEQIYELQKSASLFCDKSSSITLRI